MSHRMGALEPGHGMPVAEDQDNISRDVAKLMSSDNKHYNKRRFGVSWLVETWLSHACCTFTSTSHSWRDCQR